MDFLFSNSPNPDQDILMVAVAHLPLSTTTLSHFQTLCWFANVSPLPSNYIYERCIFLYLVCFLHTNLPTRWSALPGF